MLPSYVVRERIYNKTTLDHETGCRVWTGARHSSTGAPKIKVDGRFQDARRLMFFAITGQHLGETARLKARCGERLCLDPAHLLVTDEIGSLSEVADRWTETTAA